MEIFRDLLLVFFAFFAGMSLGYVSGVSSGEEKFINFMERVSNNGKEKEK